MAGGMIPAHPPPTAMAASMAGHAQDLGLSPGAHVEPRAWKRTLHGAVHGARTARLAALAPPGQHGGSLPGDAAYNDIDMYIAGVTPGGQVGAWAWACRWHLCQFQTFLHWRPRMACMCYPCWEEGARPHRLSQEASGGGSF